MSEQRVAYDCRGVRIGTIDLDDVLTRRSRDRDSTASARTSPVTAA